MNGLPPPEIKDIQLPGAISWWPPAPGWWLVFIILLLAAWFLFGFFRQKIKQRKPYLAANSALEALVKKHQDNKISDTELLLELSKFIRSVAMEFYGREHIAGLTGLAWLQFLDSKGKTNSFSEGVGQSLEIGPYQPNPTLELDTAEFIILIQKWLKTAYKDQA